jgi:hypothetical protein
MRNEEERSAIRDTIIESALKHGLRDDMYDTLVTILDEYVTQGIQKSGTVVLNGIELEYSLPMRRVQKEHVRIHKPREEITK